MRRSRPRGYCGRFWFADEAGSVPIVQTQVIHQPFGVAPRGCLVEDGIPHPDARSINDADGMLVPAVDKQGSRRINPLWKRPEFQKDSPIVNDAVRFDERCPNQHRRLIESLLRLSIDGKHPVLEAAVPAMQRRRRALIGPNSLWRNWDFGRQFGDVGCEADGLRRGPSVRGQLVCFFERQPTHVDTPPVLLRPQPQSNDNEGSYPVTGGFIEFRSR
jgi:hypothetical protein